MKKSTKQTLNVIAQTIYDKKGFNILALDVKGLSNLTDYYVIAEGNIDRHVKALASTLVQVLGEMGERPWHVEGEVQGDWIVIDIGDVIIHLFDPETREKYCLEELWKEAKIVDLDIKVTQGAHE